jgi:hypothetical protein
MAKRFRLGKPELAGELEKLSRQAKLPREVERLRAVSMAMSGDFTLEQIALARQFWALHAHRERPVRVWFILNPAMGCRAKTQRRKEEADEDKQAFTHRVSVKQSASFCVSAPLRDFRSSHRRI